MKTTGLKLMAVSFIATSILACGKKDAVKTEDKKDVLQATDLSTNYTVDAAGSTLGWKGTKVGGAHNGTINITEGTIAVEKNNITAGNFTIDMKTIKVLDLAGTDGEAKLKGHLESPDFFEIEKYPTAKFEITGSEKLTEADAQGNNYKIMGNLTIKDVTKNITIPANVTMDANQFTATSKFNVDRTDFGIKYKSGKFDAAVKDKAIGDIMEFDLNLKATAKK
jgi:polyisoprenoid-binding protein YceI